MRYSTVKALMFQIQDADDRLSELITKLWKEVAPSSEEQEHAVLELERYDIDPTDLQVLKEVIFRREGN